MSENTSAIRCPVCFRHCLLEEGRTGSCLARANIGGKSVSLNYGQVTSPGPVSRELWMQPALQLLPELADLAGVCGF